LSFVVIVVSEIFYQYIYDQTKKIVTYIRTGLPWR